MDPNNILADIGKLPPTEKTMVDELIRVSKIDRDAADLYRHDAAIQSSLSKVMTEDEMARRHRPNYGLEKAERITKHYDAIEKYSHDLQRKLAYAEKNLHTIWKSPREQFIERLTETAVAVPIKLRDDQSFWRREPAVIERRRQLFENADRRIFEETQRWEKQSKRFQDYGSPILSNIHVKGVNNFLDNYEKIYRRIPMSVRDEHRAITEQITKPVIACSRFNRRTLNRFESHEDPSAKIAYLLSIEMAERQINDGLPLVDKILPFADYGDDQAESDSQIIPINLFENQRGELRENVDHLIRDESSDAFDYSLSAQISNKFQNCLVIVNRCNQLGRRFRAELIFNLDGSVPLMNYHMLYSVANSELIFVKIVDQLNRLIFGIHKNNRFFPFDNWLMADEMLVLKAIRSMKNNFSRSHLGGQKLFDESYDELDSALRFLGFDEYPVKSKDFKLLQLNLYGKLELFLKLLETRLSSNTGH